MQALKLRMDPIEYVDPSYQIPSTKEEDKDYTVIKPTA